MRTIISAPLTPLAATSDNQLHLSATAERNHRETSASVIEGLLRANRMINDADMGAVRGRVYSLDVETLERFQRAIACGQDAAEVLLHLLVFDPNDDIINATAYFMPDLSEETWSSSASLVRGLTCYDNFPHPFDFINAAPSVKRQCLALLKVANALNKHSGVIADSSDSPIGFGAHQGLTWTTINDQQWEQLVLERPSDADRITSIIKQHGNIGANAVRGLLDGGPPQFAKGIL